MVKENENLLDLICIIPWKLNFAAALIIWGSCHYLLPRVAPDGPIGQALAASAPTLGNVFALTFMLGGIFSLLNCILKSRLAASSIKRECPKERPEA